VSLVPGEPENLKITWPDDLVRAGALMRRGVPPTDLRVGLGWDVHPLVPGRPFVLAGIVLDETFGPRGHSDGDPLCHAIADALLGAACLGDIGTLFPDDDPASEGLPGCDLLAGAVARLGEAGWLPVHVDAVVIADRPQIAPAREPIRAALAAVLGVAPGCVSVKGKRTEGLGGLAGGAGVGCRAIAQIARRPA
jgi:2-C-methyl-D-erythritol 2,4-cyclodiphosphate synthase